MSEIDQALPSGESGVSGAETLRLLSLMAAPTAFARAASRWAAVYVERAGVTLVAGRAPVGSLQDLKAGGFAAGSGPKPDYRLTEAGLELSRRLLVGDVPDDHATRQMALAVRRPAGDSPALLVNEAESPLLWLFRRRGRDGASLIGEAEFAAGDRLRADIDRADDAPPDGGLGEARQYRIFRHGPERVRNCRRGKVAGGSGAVGGRAGILGLAARCLRLPETDRPH